MNVNALLSSVVEQSQAKNNTNNTSSATSTSGINFSDYLQNASSSVSTTVTLDQIFEAAAQTYDVDVNLLRAIGMAESSFHTDATSRSGAQGIMQLMPGTADYLGVNDAYDPKENIFGGAKYISNLLKQYDGNVTLALAAYNAGPGNVKKYGGVPPFEETQNYVKKVTNYYENGVTIPESRNTVTVSESSALALAEIGYSNASTSTLNAASTATSNTSADDSSHNNVTHVWNTDHIDNTAVANALSGTDSDTLLTQLKTLLETMDEENNDFSYEDYGRFLKVYLDRVGISTFQKAVNGQDASIPEELENALAEFQAEMNGEDSSSQDDLTTLYQSINYNPTVLKLMTGEDE